MAAALSFCSSLTPKLSHNQTPTLLSLSRTNLQLISRSLSSLMLNSRKQTTLPFTAKSTDTEAAVSAIELETEKPESENGYVVDVAEPKCQEVLAAVMVGCGQYMVFPGHYIFIQRLKGANVNDEITLNKVLLVGIKTIAYTGKPIVPNAKIHAIVEEQTLDNKVVVF